MKKLNLKKEQNLLVVSAGFLLLIFISTVFYLSLNSRGASLSNSFQKQKASPLAPQTEKEKKTLDQSFWFERDDHFTLSFNPTSLQTKVGEKIALDLLMETTKRVNLFAVSARFSYKFNQKPPLLPQSNQMKINTELVEEKGWSFPINKIWVDLDQKMVICEIAAVNLETTGYPFSGSGIIATLELVAQEPTEQLLINFDPTLTVVTTKKSEVIKPTLENGTYQIN